MPPTKCADNELPSPQLSELPKLYQELLGKFDRDGSKSLSRKELYEAVTARGLDSRLSIAAAAMLAAKTESLADGAVRGFLDLILPAKNKETDLTAGELRAFTAANNSDKTDPLHNAGKMLRVILARSSWDGDCAVSPQFTPDSVIQGDSPFCKFLAALSSVANAESSILKNLMHAEDSGYAVQLPGLTDRKVHVAVPTAGEYAFFSAKNSSVGWAGIFEKALRQELSNGHPTLLPTDQTLAQFDTGLRLIFKDGVHEAAASAPVEEQRLLLNKVAGKSAIMIAATDARLDAALPAERKLIRSDHAYSVLGYNPKTDTIELRDTLGITGPITDVSAKRSLEDGPAGRIFLQLSQFRRIFSVVSWVEIPDKR